MNREKLLGGSKGFTLIEMAIVLIIIGIIIGAVIKGKDIVKSAEQKRLYTKFLNSWVVAYDSYYDRTGWILLDVRNTTNSGRRDGKCSGRDGRDDSANLVAQLERVGLKAPNKGPSGSECQRQYTDSEGVQGVITIAFLNDIAVGGNFIQINNIPLELGIAWDKIIDGEMDGTEGDFLYWPSTGKADWPDLGARTGTARLGRCVLKLPF